MQYVHLGRAGVKVSRLCLGTMNFGKDTSEPDSFAIMDRALELGINFFDTADVYGGKLAEGITEQVIGRWLAQGGGRREKIVLATKVYGRMGDGPNAQKLSALHIRRACDDSLRRLKTDVIDIYQMHHVDRESPWEEIWQAMEQLVQAGKVIYIGSSNFAAWNIAEANVTAAARHGLGLVSEQSIYHLNNRTVELEVLPACQRFGLGFLPWSPIAGGLLGGVLGKAHDGRRKSEAIQARIRKHQKQLQEYETLCESLGAPPAHVAMAWLLRNPVVTAPIVGPRTLAQLDDIHGSLELQLGPETVAKLDAIWPGPGGQAPEAYAW